MTNTPSEASFNVLNMVEHLHWTLSSIPPRVPHEVILLLLKAV
jgi:hypothetical protein